MGKTKDDNAALRILTEAIKRKLRVSIRYRGQARSRVIEPHAIYTDEHGELVADCYQVRGYSSAGRPAPFWRPFRLKKISGAELTTEPFVPRTGDGFNPEKQKYRFGLVAMIGEKDASFVFPEVSQEPMGPFLPAKGSRR
ncbi:MAG: WYL domain-containing protein [Acidiferrobacteraceae bacterium]